MRPAAAGPLRAGTEATSQGGRAILLLREEEVERLLGVEQMPAAIDLVERVYRQKASGRSSRHPRVTVEFPPGRGYYTDSAIRILPGILPDLGAAALRVYSVFHQDRVAEEGPRILDYTMGTEVILFYAYRPHLDLAAIMSDYRIMNVRTAAPTGLATQLLARPASRVLGVIGAGRHAPWQIAAIRSVRPIEEVRIFSRTAESRQALARTLGSEPGADSLQVRAVDSAREAVAGADVVLTVTSANAPVIDGGWLEPGTHVNVIARGEADVETVRRAALVTCSDRQQILEDTPAFRPVPEVLEKGIRRAEEFEDLDQVLVHPPGFLGKERTEVTLFLSQGVGLWDAALAGWVYEQATSRGLGTWLEL